MARELAASNQGNVELGVALALALAGRGDAFAAFARRAPAPSSRLDDLGSAERDYSEAVDLLAGLEQRRAIAVTDLTTLEYARRELARLRREIGSRTAQ